jgi:uncharacterized membrane protein
MSLPANSMMFQSLAVFLAAGMPVGELRAAIPLGLFVYGMPVSCAYILSVIGNMLPVLLVYGFGGMWLRRVERRKGRLQRMTDWFTARAKRKVENDVARNGLFVAIMLFVAVPLPFTGAYTGAIAAFALGMPFRRALLSIFLGVAVAGLLVVLAATGAVAGLRAILFQPL